MLTDRFSLINGVSSVQLTGALYKVMYVRLLPEQMAGRGVTTTDIIDALRDENVELPGGEVRNDATTMSVRTARLYRTAEDFSYLMVRHTEDGTPIYLKDVADVAIGAQNEDATFKSNGVSSLSLGIVPMSDANRCKPPMRYKKKWTDYSVFCRTVPSWQWIMTRPSLLNARSTRSTTPC